MTFIKQGWGAAQHFDIASIQPHVEIINHEAARNTINYLQHVMPILFAPTLSGPFMDGQIAPDLEERYRKAPTADTDPLKIDTIEAMEQGEHHSYRPFGRFFGSPSGGILQSPIPVDEGKYIETISTLLEDGAVNSVGRVGGHHTDRYRVDIPDHGTIELCALDPAGGRIERVIAMREFTRALAWKMQMHYINGDWDQKAAEYSALFGREPSAESFQTDHFNTMKVAKDGPNAIIEGMDGGQHAVSDLWKQLEAFVQEPLIDEARGINYRGLPPGIVDEISRSFMDPTEQFERYRDANGVTTSRGYLETGIGTSSQWRLQGAKDRIASGVTELDAIMADTIDVGRTYHHHVKTTTVDDIRRMFTPDIETEHHSPGTSPVVVFEG